MTTRNGFVASVDGTIQEFGTTGRLWPANVTNLPRRAQVTFQTVVNRITCIEVVPNNSVVWDGVSMEPEATAPMLYGTSDRI